MFGSVTPLEDEAAASTIASGLTALMRVYASLRIST